jgi:hypothetical protein
VPAHHVGLVAASGVETADGLAAGVEHAGGRVGLQAGEGAEAAGEDLDRVEGAFPDRGQ